VIAPLPQKDSLPSHFEGLALSILFQNSNDLIVIVKRSGEISKINPAFALSLGLKERDVLGSDFRSLMEFKDRYLYSKSISSIWNSDDEVKLDLRLTTDSSGSLPFHFKFSKLSNDLFMGVGKLRFYFGKDVSENISLVSPQITKPSQDPVQHELERSLRDSHVYMTTVLERITDGFFIVDRNWKVIYLNRMAEIIAQRPRAEVIGKHLWKEYPELVSTTIYEKYNEAMSTNKPLVFEEYLPPLGAWYETYLYPGAEGLSIYFHDITEKRTAKHKMEMTIDQLKITTANLKRSNEDLEQFAAVASHDLKEPLRTILLNLELLQRTSETTPSQNSHIDEAASAARRNLNLIDALLSYALATPIENPFSLVDLNEVLELVMTNLHSSVVESDAKIEIAKLPSVFGSPILLMQMFQNIISNAVKFKSDLPPKIEISCKHELESFVIAVSDNGIGMPQASTTKIFNIFHRLHEHSNYPGTGIGLALVKKIADLHSAKIWVESEVGAGSTFYLQFPRNVET